MTGKRNPNRGVKRHYSERFRFRGAKVERWTNAKSAVIAFHLGKGMTSVDVSKMLGDGTSPETIRRMETLWGLPKRGRGRKFQINVSQFRRKQLERHAKRKGVAPETLLERVCDLVLKDNMVDAVLDEDAE